MEEKKLTAEEIVKKLNYIKEQYLSYIYNDDDECKVLFVDDILDLIHRLQDENNQIKSNKFASWKLKFFRLKEEFYKELAEHEEFAKKANAEIEGLTEERDKYQEKWQTSYMNELNLQKQVDELTERAEIAEEIANTYQSESTTKCWVDYAVKQAVKDTAKEIFTDLLKEFSIRKSCGNADVVVREMASRKGVEVE